MLAKLKAIWYNTVQAIKALLKNPNHEKINMDELIAILLIPFGLFVLAVVLVLKIFEKVARCETCGKDLRYNSYDGTYICDHCNYLDRFEVDEFIKEKLR